MYTNYQLFKLYGLRTILNHPFRKILLLLVIGLGSFLMFFGITGFSNNQQETDKLINLLAGKSKLTIQDRSGYLKPEWLSLIRSIPGVKSVAPLIGGPAMIQGHDKTSLIWGIDPDIDFDVREYKILHKKSLNPEDIFITDTQLKKNNYHLGQKLTLIGSGGFFKFHIAGVIEPNGVGSLNDGNIILMHYSGAQRLFGAEGFNLASIVPMDNKNIPKLYNELSKNLPKTINIDPAEEFHKKSMATRVAEILEVLVTLLPILLGGLIIFNSMTFTVAKQKTEIGILRSIGATKGMIKSIYLIQSMVFGLVGGFLGIGLGLLSASGKGEVYIDGYLQQYQIIIPPWAPFVSFFLVLVVVVISTLLPAGKAAKLDPIDAITQAWDEDKFLTTPIRPQIIGIACVLGLILLASLFPIRQMLSQTRMASLMSLITIVLTTLGGLCIFPLLFNKLLKLLPKFAHRFLGPGGILAVAGITKRPVRTVITSLMISVTILLIVLGNGIGQGVSAFYHRLSKIENIWDLQIIGMGPNPRTPLAPITDFVVDQITALPNINLIASESHKRIKLGNNHNYLIRAMDLEPFKEGKGQFSLVAGDQPTILEQLNNVQHPAILVGGWSALDDGLKKVGQKITIQTPLQQHREFEVVGVLSQSKSQIIMSKTLFTQFWGNHSTNRLTINFKPGTDIKKEKQSLITKFGSSIQVLDKNDTNKLYRNPYRTIGYLIQFLLLPFIVLGIANTLIISILDRRREIGVLRAIGTKRGQIISSVVYEVFITVALGCVVTLPVALYSLQMMLLEQTVGVVISPNINGIIITLIYLTVVSLISAWLPARYAAKTNIINALRYDG